MKYIDDWLSLSRIVEAKQQPVVVMIDQADCPFCRRVEDEFFAAIFANGDLVDKAYFGKISIDADQTIVDANGEKVSTRQFLSAYSNGFLTPTILFLDSQKTELVEKMIGLGTPDYYGFYLEKAIKTAIKKHNNEFRINSTCSGD